MDIVIAESLRQSARVKTRAVDTAGPQVAEAARRLADCLGGDHRAFIIGNGGSAADAQHFAAEFTGKFQLPRQPLPVLALSTDTSALTCIGNDYGFEAIFSRQVEALARPGDVLIAISTSGNSENVVRAAEVAQENGVFVIGMTGERTGLLDAHADLMIKAPSSSTARIQECQMTMLHIICDLTERILLRAGSPAVTTSGLLPHELLEMREEWRRQGLSVVSTNGCFDVIHAGHLDSLSRAASFGDVLVVLINSDESVRRAKGENRPINPQRARAGLLQALGPVDHVFVFEQDDPAEVLAELRPDVHCKGEEYASGRFPVPEKEVVERFGGRMEFLPRTIDVSTTAILDRLEVIR
ncbi:SIS domain-containing protein [Kineosporia sp. J2-2]|uniref:Phosphoheptose isomerase n=1 Tax=Kineosporia corallincola TaxID=2835133 RepID=A0ABS5TEI9_9ACTN|nr:SIS domain-containing protein [Kineosporia corallincola]MBT0769461.1 SIS domain-containing protein [Kineosporia corallincola]